MSVLQVEHLTKDYGHGRGVFDVTFGVEEGEVFGFLGPNGAGKTTTIRHIMGFSRPQSGATSVRGLDSWERHSEIQKSLGYLPGEIALPESLTGTQFIDMMAALRGMTDMRYADELIDRFELEAGGNLKRMSLGTKRKLAVVTAFMHDPDILVLDEPTSGLDLVMQDVFVEFVRSEKRRGKTILLSSHMFSEVDATCDRIAIIKEGRLVSTFVADDLRHNDQKEFKVGFASADDFEGFLARAPRSGPWAVVGSRPRRNQAKVAVADQDVGELIAALADRRLEYLTEVKFTLEDHFMRFYERGAPSGEGAADAWH